MSKMSLGSLDVIYIMMESVIGICAVVGNVLVVWAVRLNPALQKTTFFYIVSLALSDIAMGILVVPLAVMVSLGAVMHFYSCPFMCCLMMVFSHASILSLLAVAVDRYLRVKLPIRYRAAVTKQRICVTLGLSWLVSVLVGLVPMLGWNQCTGSSSFIECRYPAVMRMDYVVYFSFFTWTLLPLLIMCALYTEIFYIMWIKLNQNSASLPGGETVCGKEYKMAKYLALILFLFAVSWLPLGILNCTVFFCPSCAIPQPLMYLGILLSHANSAMNPVVYAFKIQKFKETYAFILRTYILLQKSESVISSVEPTVELGVSTM
ncbi:adenosine receptor A3-like [Athene cunicularia]|uniref:adenosine receptor A3-like n=1 Tax=Athene cunicularia TaxID=194338 RepID=UPI000EF70027|nr:adenosine receptor A3-like [Athene cunicularia]